MDPFGNYVVQNFFKQVDAQLQEELYRRIAVDQPLVAELQQSQFGNSFLTPEVSTFTRA
jgi:hypothetical protein